MGGQHYINATNNDTEIPIIPPTPREYDSFEEEPGRNVFVVLYDVPMDMGRDPAGQNFDLYVWFDF